MQLNFTNLGLSQFSGTTLRLCTCRVKINLFQFKHLFNNLHINFQKWYNDSCKSDKPNS